METSYRSLPAEMKAKVARAALLNSNALTMRSLNRMTRQEPVDNALFIDRLRKLITFIRTRPTFTAVEPALAIETTHDHYLLKLRYNKFEVVKNYSTVSYMDEATVIRIFGYLSGRVSSIGIAQVRYNERIPPSQSLPIYNAPDFKLEDFSLLT